MSRRSRRNRVPQEAVEVTIDRLTHEGRGITNIDGKIAFVDGALPTEKVSAKYLRRRGKFDELRVEQILEAAPERCEPPCAYAALCGGCSLQHFSPKHQIDFKQSVLLEKICQETRLPIESISLLPAITADHENYRRKARLAVRFVARKGGTLVGFREKYSSFITDMSDCSVLVGAVAKLIQPLRELFNGLAGNAEIPQIEVAVGEKIFAAKSTTAPEEATIARNEGDEPLQVAFVIRHLKPLQETDMQQLMAFAKQHTVHLYLQPAGMDSVHRVWPASEDEAERLYYRLDSNAVPFLELPESLAPALKRPTYDVSLAFHPTDFTQVNAKINQKIVQLALRLLALNDADRVLDLFCGLGNFTLPLAANAAEVVGVEGSQAMVERGTENAKNNSISNASFYMADLTQDVSQEEWARKPFTKILLDPPRSGAIEVLDRVAGFGAEKIVYISCNPTTLARDTARLLTLGYTLHCTGVMDMFPHTSHVESIAVFNRANE